jgi:tRNA G10  N-methylase Trm11
MKKNDDPNINIFTNFRLYGLREPQIIGADINHPTFRDGECFDSIVCDPPYGHRAFTRKTGKDEQKKEKRVKKIKEKYGKTKDELLEEAKLNNEKLIEEKNEDSKKEVSQSFAPLLYCSIEQIFENLLNLATKSLKSGGTLVCLYPTSRTKDELEYFILI